MDNFIRIKGARENNLKNISLDIPKNKLVVLTGLSGSGKSSLAFNTLQKECQRQYMESMGMITDFISKPDVDTITGLSPSISVTQEVNNKNPRSTVGTVTEVFTYLRILFAKLGERKCCSCGNIIKPDFEYSFSDFSNKSYSNNNIICPFCNEKLEELTMSHFSFNKPEGACPVCTGLGELTDVNTDLLINKNISILDGAVAGWDKHYIKHYTNTLKKTADYYGFNFDFTVPVSEYSDMQYCLFLYGVDDIRFKKHFPDVNPPETVSNGRFEGVVTNYLRRYAENSHKPKYRKRMEKLITKKTCPECMGNRLRKESINVFINNKSIIDLSSYSLDELYNWIISLKTKIGEKENIIAKPILDDLEGRIKRLTDVGVGYLSMNRSAVSLSGGESQRLKLASLLGSGLTGVLYVLDEPTTGLHSHDTGKLIYILKKLRDLGNTVLVIEHDTDVIREADFIIDMGPGAGNTGGQIISTGSVDEIIQDPSSITGPFLKNDDFNYLSMQRNNNMNKKLSVINASENNLKNINVDIPLGILLLITGVSGAGKSTLLFDIIDKAGKKYFGGFSEKIGSHESIKGWENIDNIITINQSPIGRTPRSNSATYTDVFTNIRNLYASLDIAKKLKIKAGDFSFNIPGGRCEKCQGAGVITIGMHFLPDVEVICPECKGKRFKPDILKVKYQDVNISDVLNLTINEALDLFREEKSIYKKLSVMKEVGLGYLHLGQPATALSGGEAQRIKLAKELGKKSKGHTLYILDEPSTGLHPTDVIKLVKLLQKLVDQGNSVIVIEHNTSIISIADWIIDFGPGGGNKGGYIVAEGKPEDIHNNHKSITGKYIKLEGTVVGGNI